MPGSSQIVPDSLYRLRIDGERVFPGTLVEHAEQVEATVLVQVADTVVESAVCPGMLLYVIIQFLTCGGWHDWAAFGDACRRRF